MTNLNLTEIREMNEKRPAGYWKHTIALLCDEVERLQVENIFLREWLRGELTIVDADIDQELEARL